MRDTFFPRKPEPFFIRRYAGSTLRKIGLRTKGRLIASVSALVLLGVLVGCAQPQGSGKGSLQGRGDDTALVIAGQQAYASQDVTSALAFYRSALAVNPNNRNALLGLGEAYLSEAQWREAAGAYREALVIDDREPTAQRGYAMALLGEGLAQEAISAIQMALVLERTPGNLLILGAALDTLSRHEEAQSAYLEGIEDAPRSLSLRNNLALSHALAGDFSQAHAIMRNVVDAPDSDLRHRYNLVLISALEGDIDRAGLDGRRAGMSSSQIAEVLAYAKSIRQAHAKGQKDLSALLGVSTVSPVLDGAMTSSGVEQ